MIMTVVTAKVAVELPAVAVKTVMTANMILHLTAVNAVIQPGMNMALIVLHWKVHMAGIALVVIAQVTATLFVVTGPVMVMKPMKHAQKIVMHLVNVMMVMYLTVLMLTAVQSLGLVTALLTVKIRLMAVI